MSITSEIARLRAAKADIKSAIEDKGVDVPNETTIDGYGELIGEIEQGTSDFDWSSIGYEEMPDELRASLEVTRDYYDLYLNNGVVPNMFRDNHFISVIPNMDYRGVANVSYLFNNCFALINLPEDFNTPDAVNISYLFAGCFSLREIPPSFQPIKATNATALFYQCRSIKEINVSLPMCTQFGAALQTCDSLTKAIINLPRNTSNLSNFAQGATALTYLELIGNQGSFSVNYSPLDLEGVTALITSVADLTGKTSATMTLHTSTKALLTAELIALATAKNWTIA